MSQDQTKKEALFNEVKGSLFEYLVGRELCRLAGHELDFLQSLDANYLNVLSQQDRMVRQFYPEMHPFLSEVANQSTKALINYLGELPSHAILKGKFADSSNEKEIFEADLIIETQKGALPLSLKLNKKHSFVNTKSGGIKSFFDHYFPFLDSSFQASFNHFVDREFIRMAHELHAMNDLEFNGNFSLWVKSGKSELPGELSIEERGILKKFYARIASQIFEILTHAKNVNQQKFSSALSSLMGFSSTDILQLVCFHEFKTKGNAEIQIHSFKDIRNFLEEVEILPFTQTSSVDLKINDLTLQIRVKPMNKFTTTAIKINCSVKFKQI
jgi:hypothetical protein